MAAQDDEAEIERRADEIEAHWLAGGRGLPNGLSKPSTLTKWFWSAVGVVALAGVAPGQVGWWQIPATISIVAVAVVLLMQAPSVTTKILSVALGAGGVFAVAFAGAANFPWAKLIFTVPGLALVLASWLIARRAPGRAYVGVAATVVLGLSIPLLYQLTGVESTPLPNATEAPVTDLLIPLPIPTLVWVVSVVLAALALVAGNSVAGLVASAAPAAQSAARPAGAPLNPTNPLAMAALIAGVFGVGFAAVVLGHVARHQIRQRAQSGDGLAIAGLVLGYIELALGVVFIVVAAIFISMSMGQLGAG